MKGGREQEKKGGRGERREGRKEGGKKGERKREVLTWPS